MIIRQKNLASLCLSILLGFGANAQLSSHDRNAVPISGTDNAAYGFGVLTSAAVGNYNTGLGINALFSNVAGGDYNTAGGWSAMYSNTSGYRNAAFGSQALHWNTTGQSNSGFGASALYYNTSGYGNAANGFAALFENTTGRHNTAMGKWALYNNTTAGHNSALGFSAGFFNTTGENIAAVGAYALYNNTTGNNNTALGGWALTTNTVGDRNTAVGYLSNVGSAGLTNSTAIGYGAVVTSSDECYIGDNSNPLYTVRTFTGVYTTSDGRFKTNVKEEDIKGLDFIKLLRPVMYNFDTRKLQAFVTQNMSEETKKLYMDKDFEKSSAVRKSGFIAQEVEEAARKSGFDFDGVHKPENDYDNYAVNYSQFVVPLVKAVQEQQQMIDQQQQVNETLAATVAAQQKQIEELKKMVASIAGQPVSTDNGSKLAIEEISVYPNPNKGTFMVNTKTIDSGVLEVMDITGKTVQTIELKQTTFIYPVDLTGFAKGTYLLNITSKGKTISKKIIVE